MAAISGLAASVAWTGYEGLYTASFIKPYRFQIDVQGGALDTTAFSVPTIVASNIAAPYSWTATITARMPTTPASGYSAGVSWGAGNHVTNAHEWNLDIAWGEKQVTAFNGTGVVAHSYIPTLARWSGGYRGYIDGTTATTLPTVPGGTIQTLTMKAIESGGTDEQFSGTAIVTQLTGDVGVDSGGDYSYAFTGTGQLTVPAAATFFGVNDNGIFDNSAGTLKTVAAGELTLTAASGRTFVGNAFPVAFGVRVGVASQLECVVRVRGDGALTIA